MSALSPECLSDRQWRERLAHRFDPERSETETWPQDLDHLDRCDSCRERAVELDPTLLFQRLAAPVPAFDEEAEAASMRRAVAALRRADRIVQPERRPAATAWTIGGRWAAAALVAMSALSLGAGVWSGSAPGPAAPVKAAKAVTPAPERPHAEATLQEALDSLPLIEPVGASTVGRVEGIWETDEMAVIWVGDSEGPQDV